MDKYGLFIHEASIQKLPRNVKHFIENVSDTKLFTAVKFISCPGKGYVPSLPNKMYLVLAEAYKIYMAISFFQK